MAFDRWDCAVALFPFADRRQVKGRPVVILSTAEYLAMHGLLVAAMITSASEGRWPSDHDIVDLASAGLFRACVVRVKLATLTADLVGQKIGSLAEVDQSAVRRQLATILPLDSART